MMPGRTVYLRPGTLMMVKKQNISIKATLCIFICCPGDGTGPKLPLGAGLRSELWPPACLSQEEKWSVP